ncbi:MAG: DMT family transporter [Caldilineales bacterium]|nr:DMT family transporter [Caldilineales bacterium]
MSKKDTLLFLLLSAIWGSSFMFIKLGLEGGFSPMALVSLRLLFGALLMAGIALRRGHRLPTEGRVLAGIAFLGFINNVVPFSLITWSEQHIDSSLAAILNSTVPLFAVILSHFALADESFTWRRVLGVLLGFGGVLVLFAPGLVASAGSAALWGQLAVIVASAGYAIGSVFARKRLQRVPAPVLTTVQLGFALLWTLPLTALERPWTLELTGMAWFAALWLGLLGTGMAYLLFFILLRSIGATPTTMVTYVIPLFAVIFGVLFLREQVQWQHLLALILIIGGVAMVNR